MSDRVPAWVTTFFEDFQRASDEGDRAWMEAAYAPSFLVLDPSAERVVTREQLLGSLGMRRGLFDSMGVDRLTLAGLETRDLDARHVLASTVWLGRSTTGPDLELPTDYLIRHEDGRDAHIVLYLNHNDIAAIARARSPE